MTPSLTALPNQRMKLARRSGHVWWNKSFFVVAHT